MPDNASGTGTEKVVADELTYSGDVAKLQIMRLVHVSGAEGAKVVHEIADATNGIDVDVTRVQGTVDVDVQTMPEVVIRQESDTATLSSVASSASSVTLLSANGARKGATIWNDSAEDLYVKFGTTASATSFTVKLIADAYYEIPYGYTGRIDGIWASADGAARITEIT